MRDVPRTVWLFVAIQLLLFILELVAKSAASVPDVIIGALVVAWIVKRSRAAWWLGTLGYIVGFVMLGVHHVAWPWSVSVWLALVVALASLLVLLTPTMRAWCPPVRRVGPSGLKPRTRPGR